MDTGLQNPSLFLFFSTLKFFFPNFPIRAADWKLDEPDWTGRLKVVVKDKNLKLRLEDKNSGCWTDIMYLGSVPLKCFIFFLTNNFFRVSVPVSCWFSVSV